MAAFTFGDLYGGFQKTTRDESVPEAGEQVALAVDTAPLVAPAKKANVLMGVVVLIALLVVLGAF